MRVALVSREYEQFDFSKPLNRIVEIADDYGCEYVVFSLFSLHRKKALLKLSDLFSKTKFVRRVILETGDLWNETDLRTEILCKELEYPLMFRRQFAFSTEPNSRKQNLIRQLQFRSVDNTCTLICGETNMLKVDRKQKQVLDPHNILDALIDQNISLVISPWHTKCFRYEINEKRRALSKGRWVLSTWNQYKKRGRDGKYPWVAFCDGLDRTTEIIEYKNLIPNRPDIRVGFIDVT